MEAFRQVKRLFGAAISILAGLILIYSGIGKNWNAAELRDKGVKVTGTVEEVGVSRGRGTSYYLTVSYQPESKANPADVYKRQVLF